MAITLFRKANFEGDDRFEVTGDVADLSDTPVKRAASSMRMTSQNDRVLLFKNKDWNGHAMFRSGRQDIPNLGSPAKGGKTLFGDSVASVRVTPFSIRLFINIIAMDDGSFPGFRSPDAEIAAGTGSDIFPTFIPEIVAAANAIWSNVLLQLDVDSVVMRRSTKFHDMRGELYPLLWQNFQKANCANIYLVEELHNAQGITPSPGWGRGSVIECHSTPDAARVSDILAHEIGHYLGIFRHRGRSESSNLMTGSGRISQGFLTNQQVEELHKTLARNVLRQSLRNE